MLYYVKSGDLDISTNARSYKQAAVRALNSSERGLGICVVVSKTPIEDNHPDQVYFLTESILQEGSAMRLVR
jgi:hypothetical protein